MAHCPEILKVSGLIGLAIEKSGHLPKGLVPLINTRVATINGCSAPCGATTYNTNQVEVASVNSLG